MQMSAGVSLYDDISASAPGKNSTQSAVATSKSCLAIVRVCLQRLEEMALLWPAEDDLRLQVLDLRTL